MYKNIIIIINGDNMEAWSSLSKMTQAHPEFSYEYLKKKSRIYPFKYKGWEFYKVRFNGRQYYANQGLKE